MKNMPLHGIGAYGDKKNAETSIAFLKRSKYLGKESGFLKRYVAQKVQAQLYSTFLSGSIITTQVLSIGLKGELHLLPVSEMKKKKYTVALNFGG